MAECNMRCGLKADILESSNGTSPYISAINTNSFPLGSPLIPAINLFMRDPLPQDTKLKKQKSPIDEMVQCDCHVYPKPETWKSSYLRKYPEVWPHPTAEMAITGPGFLHPPKTLDKLMLSKKELAREIAKQKLLAFYGNAYDLETICRDRKKKKKKQRRRPKSDTETGPDPEPESEEEEPSSASTSLASERVKAPAKPLIRKTKEEAPPSIRRSPKPYSILHDKEKEKNTNPTPNKWLGFLPGKPKPIHFLFDHMIRASGKRPIAKEAEPRFAITKHQHVRTSNESLSKKTLKK